MKKRSWLLTLAAPVVLAGSLQAANVDYFLQLDGIKGESMDSRHPETVEVLSFEWGATQDTSGGTAGKSHLQDLTCTIHVSKATPKLMLACATGQHISSATLYVRADENSTEDYYIITMSDILISSVKQKALGRRDDSSSQNSTSGDADDRPTEEVSFYYNRATFTYHADDGTVVSGEISRASPQ